ncbi:MAG: hypothetical protein H8D72_01035 [Planctomycetes bacterium]|nr:hypothetical protein [Planctomycetota bacterium]
MRALPTIFRQLLVLVLFVASTACASSIDTTAPTEDSLFGNVLIRFQDFRGGGTRLSLANEASQDRVDYYSQTRNDAGLKVTSDEIMNALVEVFEDEGFWDTARPGTAPSGASAPTEGGYTLHGILSLETSSRAGWITFRKGLTTGDLELFQSCSQAFIAIYNSTAGYQRIDNPEREGLFK